MHQLDCYKSNKIKITTHLRSYLTQIYVCCEAVNSYDGPNFSIFSPFCTILETTTWIKCKTVTFHCENDTSNAIFSSILSWYQQVWFEAIHVKWGFSQLSEVWCKANIIKQFIHRIPEIRVVPLRVFSWALIFNTTMCVGFPNREFTNPKPKSEWNVL